MTGRVGRYPSAMGARVVGRHHGHQPPDSDHWWYRLAEKDRPDGWSFFAQPGGRADGAENRENLPDGYYERMVAGRTRTGSASTSMPSTASCARGSLSGQTTATGSIARSSISGRGFPSSSGWISGSRLRRSCCNGTLPGEGAGVRRGGRDRHGHRRVRALLKQRLDGPWRDFPIGAIFRRPGWRQPCADGREDVLRHPASGGDPGASSEHERCRDPSGFGVPGAAAPPDRWGAWVPDPSSLHRAPEGAWRGVLLPSSRRPRKSDSATFGQERVLPRVGRAPVRNGRSRESRALTRRPEVAGAACASRRPYVEWDFG